MGIGVVRGVVTQDGQPLETAVRVHAQSDGQLVGTATSAADGSYSAQTTVTNNVLVTAMPPAGYRPISHGPVTPKTLLVGTSDTRFITTTTLSETIHPDTQAGDLLIAAVMHRAVLTPPAGWELVWWSDIMNTSYSHQLSVYQKTASAEDAGAGSTWTQASSQRMSVNISTCRDSELVSYGYAPGMTSGQVTIPTQTATGEDYVLAIATSTYAATTPENIFEVSPGWEQITPSHSEDLSNQIRLGVAIKAGPGTLTGAFSLNTEGNYATDAGCIALLLRTS